MSLAVEGLEEAGGVEEGCLGSRRGYAVLGRTVENQEEMCFEVELAETFKGIGRGKVG